MFVWICASLIRCSVERRLKNQRQIFKKRYFKNYCSFDKDANFQLYRVHLTELFGKTDNLR